MRTQQNAIGFPALKETIMTRENTTQSIDKKGLGVAALILAATLSLAACNTIEGVGEDAQSAGKKVEEIAKDNK
jgi:predicted small secreted protein